VPYCPLLRQLHCLIGALATLVNCLTANLYHCLTVPTAAMSPWHMAPLPHHILPNYNLSHWLNTQLTHWPMTHCLIAKLSYCLVPFGFKAQCVPLPHFPIAWLHLIDSLSCCSIAWLSHCPTVSLSRLLSHSFTISHPCYPITVRHCLNASVPRWSLSHYYSIAKKESRKSRKAKCPLFKKNSSEIAISAQLFTVYRLKVAKLSTKVALHGTAMTTHHRWASLAQTLTSQSLKR
jgi:hypothetical protein